MYNTQGYFLLELEFVKPTAANTFASRNFVGNFTGCNLPPFRRGDFLYMENAVFLKA